MTMMTRASTSPATLISNVGFEPIEPGPNRAPPGPVGIVMGQCAYEGDVEQSLRTAFNDFPSSARTAAYHSVFGDVCAGK
jgi:hypothetical protein